MGRILRIGLDSVTNYSFQATTAYDPLAPAATTYAWPNSPAMDQAFDEPDPEEVEAEGVLVTFERFPDAFEGAMIKIRPTYNATIGEAPAFELWTHSSDTDTWTKQRRIDLFNLFVGVESNQRRIVDFTFFPFEHDVDKVWITMDPGPVGTPQMRFISIQLFGQCEQTLRIPDPDAGGGGADPCLQNPFGLDADGNPCLTPAANCSDFPEFCTTPPPLDLCNPVSIEAYEEFLRPIPGALDEFESWFAVNAALIASICAGNAPPGTEPPMPLPPLPPLPPLDLCDPTSVDAFRAAVGGDAEQLTAFDTFVDGLDEQGFFENTCPPPEPPEQYVDPATEMPAEDPDTDNNTPFGSGPGGMPPARGSGAEPAPGSETGEGGGGSDSEAIIERTSRFILTWSGNDQGAASALTDGLITPLDPSSPFQIRTTASANYGPDFGVVTPGVQFSPSAYALLVRLRKLPFSCRVSLRMQVFRMRTTGAHPTNELHFSVSDAGIHTRAAAGSCPPGPDWIITPTGLFAPAATPVLAAENYFEYIFTGTGLSNNALLELAVPRVNPAQNDAVACSPGYEARSDPVDGVAWQRGGCIAGLTIKERDRWILDNANADFDAATPFDYEFVRPICIVFDIRLDAVVFGPGADVRSSSIALGARTDAQPVETCP